MKASWARVRHSAEAKRDGQKKIGVGLFMKMTSKFTMGLQQSLISINRLLMHLGQTPCIRPCHFTVKKNTSVLKHLFNWINNSYDLNQGRGKSGSRRYEVEWPAPAD